MQVNFSEKSQDSAIFSYSKTVSLCPRHSKALYLTLWDDRQGFAVALHLRNPHHLWKITPKRFSHFRFAGFGKAKTEQSVY